MFSVKGSGKLGCFQKCFEAFNGPAQLRRRRHAIAVLFHVGDDALVPALKAQHKDASHQAAHH
jgi:hypothetical protein